MPTFPGTDSALKVYQGFLGLQFAGLPIPKQYQHNLGTDANSAPRLLQTASRGLAGKLF